MTAYEIVSIFIGILALLIAFGSFVISLLAFLPLIFALMMIHNTRKKDIALGKA